MTKYFSSLAYCQRKSFAAVALGAFASFATVGSAQETGAAQDPSGAPDTIGEMTFGDQSYDLTLAYWCAPRDGHADGTTLSIRVAAYDESGDVIVYGTQLDRDGDRPPVQSVSVATDPDSNYFSGDIMPSNSAEPAIRVDNGVVHINAETARGGDVEARFTLPDEPGFPGYC
jgi:hypothetical protein